ncbi:hypothetical protein ACFQGU_09060 [Longivirga aurantiaca]|uniref:HNH endonuclease n=1 Tax=Longivirga aurantiaca TaxID=1837743 RepID=A0ABW1T2F0_9ACTN
MSTFAMLPRPADTTPVHKVGVSHERVLGQRDSGWNLVPVAASVTPVTVLGTYPPRLGAAVNIHDVEQELDLIRRIDPEVNLSAIACQLLTELAPILSPVLDAAAAVPVGGDLPVCDLDYLEALVVSSGLVDEQIWCYLESRGAVTLTDRRLACDLCGEPAAYDAPVPAHGGRWANLCGTCWSDHTDNILGYGRGQVVATRDAMPIAVAERWAALARSPGRPGDGS